MNKPQVRGRVRKARSEDIEFIHAWLQKQDKLKIDGTFLCNWNMTLESFHEKELVVFIKCAIKPLPSGRGYKAQAVKI